ncbi:MAG: Co2+/Mg2+ efflux protein ApaG [Planctomycetota bacterium]|nr:MAG: Co2+/Mg2+ efflux protein ApaG [Planctomycetota bacterium]
MNPTDTTHQSGHSDVVTHGVRVQAAALFLPDRSSPEQLRYVFAYRVQIANGGDEPVTLRSRRWVITDADGAVEIVEGPGVVGEEPRLEPGQVHTYMSGCPLETCWGTMEGHFVMQRDDGSTFEAKIGRFFLAATVDPLPSQN